MTLLNDLERKLLAEFATHAPPVPADYPRKQGPDVVKNSFGIAQITRAESSAVYQARWAFDYAHAMLAEWKIRKNRAP